ncbi:MAG: hypothetical protein RR555_07785 [Bacteroidales bacterium]
MLYIIKNNYFLTDYILNKLNSDNGEIEIIPFARRSGGKHGKIRKIERYFDVLLDFKGDKSSYFDLLFLERLTKITAQDSVLFFGVENQKDLTLLSRIIPAKRKMLWAWNPMSTIIKSVIGTGEYGKMLKKHGIDVYTFDQNDAVKYKFKHTYQVYANDTTAERKVKYDIFFVGNDKGRLEDIYRLYGIFNNQGLTSSLHVIKNRHKKYDSKYNPIITNESMPYPQSIETIKESRAVLDILQANQTGQTLRPLEALFLNKKLITNNVEIINEPFYHPSLIFILGIDNIDQLSGFIHSPIIKPEAQIKERYEINNWIEQFKQGGPYNKNA